MARLLVDAIAHTHAESTTPLGELGPVGYHLGISVSRADDGSPVTGLANASQQPFRCCIVGIQGYVTDLRLLCHNEARWEDDDSENSGMYQVEVIGSDDPNTLPADTELYLGIQARTFATDGSVLDMGQTLIRFWSPPAPAQKKRRPRPRPKPGRRKR